MNKLREVTLIIACSLVSVLCLADQYPTVSWAFQDEDGDMHNGRVHDSFRNLQEPDIDYESLLKIVLQETDQHTGILKVKCKRTDIFTCKVRNGAYAGNYERRYLSGQVMLKGHMKRNMRHSTWRFYWPNGSLYAEGDYRPILLDSSVLSEEELSVKDGTWCWFYDDGVKRAQEVFRIVNGCQVEKDVSIVYADDGRIVQQMNYVSGVAQSFKSFDSHGRVWGYGFEGSTGTSIYHGTVLCCAYSRTNDLFVVGFHDAGGKGRINDWIYWCGENNRLINVTYDCGVITEARSFAPLARIDNSKDFIEETALSSVSNRVSVNDIIVSDLFLEDVVLQLKGGLSGDEFREKLKINWLENEVAASYRGWYYKSAWVGVKKKSKSIRSMSESLYGCGHLDVATFPEPDFDVRVRLFMMRSRSSHQYVYVAFCFLDPADILLGWSYADASGAIIDAPVTVSDVGLQNSL